MLKPTVAYELFGGKVEVLIYGKSPHELGEIEVAIIARERKIGRIYHPDTHTFNAKICRTIDFPTDARINGVRIYSGVLVDGVSRIGRGEAVWLRTADCPTIIGLNSVTKEMVVAHAGRASLIDQEGVRTCQSSRNPESVVQAMCEQLCDLGQRVSVGIEVHSCCGIGPMNFRHPTDHPEHGSFNAKMNRYIAVRYSANCFLNGNTGCGALDLHQLIRNQFQLCGVPPDNISHDKIDTVRDRDYFFSRRGGDATGHNTILVIRRA
ncbi:MAG: laccase domain-containing protein [Candidatus Vogelbacteria bacterium]